MPDRIFALVDDCGRLGSASFDREPLEKSASNRLGPPLALLTFVLEEPPEAERPGVRRRTKGERDAYLAGFEAGADLALQNVRRLNFSDVAQRVRPLIDQHLELAGVLEVLQGGEADER